MIKLKSSYMRDSLSSVRTIPSTGTYESIVNYHLKDRSILISRTLHSMQNGVEVETRRSFEAVKDGKTLMRSHFTFDKETNCWKQSAPAELEVFQPKAVLQPRTLQAPQSHRSQEPEMGGPDM